MPCGKMKKRRFLNVMKNRPCHSALFGATENSPYAELGIMGIFAAKLPGWVGLSGLFHPAGLCPRGETLPAESDR